MGIASNSRCVTLTPTFAFRVSSRGAPVTTTDSDSCAAIFIVSRISAFRRGDDHVRALSGGVTRQDRRDLVLAETEVEKSELSARGRRRGERGPDARQCDGDARKRLALFVDDDAVDISADALSRGDARSRQRDHGDRDRTAEDPKERRVGLSPGLATFPPCREARSNIALGRGIAFALLVDHQDGVIETRLRAT